MLEQKPQPVLEKFNLFHRYLLWFVKQKFCYSVLRACKVYTDDHYQTATKNVLPFIRNNEWTFYVRQNFVLTRHFSTVLALECSRPSTPRITHSARANWFVFPPILSGALVYIQSLPRSISLLSVVIGRVAVHGFMVSAVKVSGVVSTKIGTKSMLVHGNGKLKLEMHNFRQ